MGPGAARHTILRLYPILGHVRFLMEMIRPEIRQYFIESNTEATPFDRETRDLVYERAKGTKGDEPFGTERDVNAIGYEFLRHSLRAHFADDLDPRVRLGGHDCTQPYDIAMLNVSAMSFGALSANAITALNAGAARGGFAHDTGEGGISPYHLAGGGDLIWEIGSGYFGCRDAEGRFDAARFAEKATLPAVKAISIKLSQGAKPGLGGVLPGAKVSAEIAATRGVPMGRTVVSPPAHSAFGTPVEFAALHRDPARTLRRQAGGLQTVRRRAHRVPVDLQGDPGHRHRPRLHHRRRLRGRHRRGTAGIRGPRRNAADRGPDAGAQQPGRHRAAGPDQDRSVGQGGQRRRHRQPGLPGCGLHDVGAGHDVRASAAFRRCKCHTNRCPTGVATQDPARSRALDVDRQDDRGCSTTSVPPWPAPRRSSRRWGCNGFHELSPAMLNRRIEGQRTRTYAEIYDWLVPGELLDDPPESWRSDWIEASADAFV